MILQVSAYVTAAHIKFLLLHDGRNEEAIKGFFRDVYDAYLRVRLACTGSITAMHLTIPVVWGARKALHNLPCGPL